MSPSASARPGYLRAPPAWARLERASFLKKPGKKEENLYMKKVRERRQ